MKCTNCDGRGAVQIAPNVKGLKRCPVCDGSGEVSQILQTNEEWFNTMSTQEKAIWLTRLYRNSAFNTLVVEIQNLEFQNHRTIKKLIEEWLKQPHSFE